MSETGRSTPSARRGTSRSASPAAPGRNVTTETSGITDRVGSSTQQERDDGDGAGQHRERVVDGVAGLNPSQARRARHDGAAHRVDGPAAHREAEDPGQEPEERGNRPHNAGSISRAAEEAVGQERGSGVPGPPVAPAGTG